MPNAENFPNGIISDVQSRPDRRADKDTLLLQRDFKQVLFGETTDDVLEVYVYDADDNIVAHLNYGPTNKALSLTKILSDTQNTDYLDINLPILATDLGVTPGRYTMSLNFFRNEVGSEETERLYIDEISRSRTELRLRPFRDTTEIRKQIYEFVTPSISKLFAQALIDEMFGRAIGSPSFRTITVNDIINYLDGLSGSVPFRERLSYLGLHQSFANLCIGILSDANKLAVDYVALASTDRNIQKNEIDSILEYAIATAVRNAQIAGSVDARFVITR